MKCGIVLDDWKREIFQRHLTESGYQFKLLAGPITGLLTVTVDTENPEALQVVIKAAVAEADLSRGQTKGEIQ